MATGTLGRRSPAGRGGVSDRPRRVLVGGSVRSGKSAFALSLARQLGPRRVLLATAEALDPEMAERIHRHRAERGDEFVTVEEPLEIAPRVRALAAIDVLVLDCLTLWIANLLLRGEAEQAIVERVDELAGLLAGAPFHSVVVTNEVGMGVVPESALGRAFRDVCGRAHRRLAHDATEVYLATLGLLLRLRPEPIVVQPVAEPG